VRCQDDPLNLPDLRRLLLPVVMPGASRDPLWPARTRHCRILAAFFAADRLS
jgi:hypothetical protein